MANNRIEEQVSMNIDHNDENLDSGSGSNCPASAHSSAASSDSATVCDSADSASSAPGRGFGAFGAIGMEKLDESNPDYQKIKRLFVGAMGPAAGETTVEAIHRNSSTDPAMKAKLMAFKISGDAVAKKNGRSPDFKEANLRDGWYPGSKEKIAEIVAHGFNGLRKGPNQHGLGVQLNAQKFAFDGALLSPVDTETGLKHILFCRMIIGNMEKIEPGSKQCCPSSKAFDSGVDNLITPRKYIVWNAFMNTRIVPSYVVSFKSLPSLQRVEPKTKAKQQIALGALRTKQQIAFGVRLMQEIASGIRPPSLMSLEALMYVLERHLTRSKMQILMRCYLMYRRDRITRQQMAQVMRQIVGERLLNRVIKTYGNKFVRPGKPRG